MRLKKKSIAFPLTLALGIIFTSNVMAQDSNCSIKNENCAEKKSSCNIASVDSEKSTSGCSPSGCRGAKTKFGEAKVISDLRLDLIAVKADMEQSTSPIFDARTFDIHGIIGETDEESLQIIIREVKIMEDALSEKLKYESLTFNLPENKAKQVTYLQGRIDKLKQVLSTQ